MSDSLIGGHRHRAQRRCVLRLDVLNSTRSDGHKFKVSELALITRQPVRLEGTVPPPPPPPIPPPPPPMARTAATAGQGRRSAAAKERAARDLATTVVPMEPGLCVRGRLPPDAVQTSS